MNPDDIELVYFPKRACSMKQGLSTRSKFAALRTNNGLLNRENFLLGNEFFAVVTLTCLSKRQRSAHLETMARNHS
jgi:hypothetical protein